MDLTDRLLYLTIGGVVGFVAGFIVAKLTKIEKELDQVIEHENLLGERDEKGAAKMFHWRNVAVGLAVLLTAISAFMAAKNAADQAAADKKDDIARCVAAVDTRTVQRDTVEAVYTLATTTLPKDMPKTEAEIVRYNRFIDQANRFRSDMYDKIKPSSVCAPYVKDDNVRPPPPNFPRFPR